MNSTTEILEQRLNTGPGPNPTPILENHPTQSAATIDGLRSALFGIPFIAAGGLLPPSPFGAFSAPRHPPNWGVCILGPLFVFGGLFFPFNSLRRAPPDTRYFPPPTPS